MPTDTLPAEPPNEAAASPQPLVLGVQPHPPTSPASIVWEGFVSLLVVAAAVGLGTILAFVIGIIAGWIPIC